MLTKMPILKVATTMYNSWKRGLWAFVNDKMANTNKSNTEIIETMYAMFI
jgi:hypothetical protein